MANISIKQLKVFVTITQHSTLTAASEALFLSKAAVSMALGEMEKQLGHSLFDRVNNRLILNQEGHKLLPLADEILHRAAGIDVLFRDDQPLSGNLKVGASDTIGNQVAPFILSGFRERTQHQDQSLFISNSALICQKLVDYELDIALIEGKTLHPELISPETIQQLGVIALSDDAAGHIGRVLRMKEGQEVLLFDGSGAEFPAVISEVSKKNVMVEITERVESDIESPLDLHLGQVISRGDKMEFTIQKSVELGVNTITPLISERCGVKLDQKRFEKKLAQWQKIAISACEQCGRNVVPEIRPIMSLEEWCQEEYDGLKLNLHPRAKYSINTLPTPVEKVRLLIGPEGGLSSDEIDMTREYQFEETLLGPRVLRTETAALTAITALQVRFGDLG